MEDLLKAKTAPEIVALSGQTVEQVKKILKETKSCKDVDDLKGLTLNEISKLYSVSAFQKEKCETVAKMNKECSPKLIFEDDPSCCESVPHLRTKERNTDKNWRSFVDDLNFPKFKVLAGLEEPQEEKVQTTVRLKGDFEQFSQWRKTAGLKTESDECTSDALNPTKELMDTILLRINDSFPNLDVKWTAGTWNPQLLVNEAQTTICLERLAVAYKGLTHITNEVNAQAIIANIVLKKLKELFI